MGEATGMSGARDGKPVAQRRRARVSHQWARLAGVLIVLVALVLAVGCSVSGTTTPSPTAAARPTPTVVPPIPTAAPTAKPSPVPTATLAAASSTPTAASSTPSPAATPSSVGTVALTRVAVKVPSGAATGQLAQPRTLSVPSGFAVSVFAAGLGAPRWLAFSPEGVLYASIPSQGRVVAMPDRNNDGVADAAITFVDSLYQPHGLAFFGGALFVAENQRVVRVSYDPKAAQPKATRVQTIIPNLPTGGEHWTRSITFGPDGKLYVSAGSSCNACVEEDSRRAAITQYNSDGSGERVFAKGFRNSVGLTWRPGTSELWAADNGRDYLGDDLPPDEINLIRDGADYGWPYCYGNRVPDPQLGSAGRCAITQPPVVALQAHSAPLGLVFYAGTQFPAEYRGDLFVAFHGSWNRTVPTGYKLVRVRMANGKPTGEVQDLVTGWLEGASVWGRPVDPVVGPDGSLYLSDDAAGVIYRITYSGGVPMKNAE